MFGDLNFDGVFDELFAQMQGDGAREAMDRAFHATPTELGKAAVDVAMQVNRS